MQVGLLHEWHEVAVQWAMQLSWKEVYLGQCLDTMKSQLDKAYIEKKLVDSNETP